LGYGIAIIEAEGNILAVLNLSITGIGLNTKARPGVGSPGCEDAKRLIRELSSLKNFI
jgi:hypothetical protein